MMQQFYEAKDFVGLEYAMNAYPWRFVQAVPFLIGLFVAAPLLSREAENGTMQLGLTQSIGHGRWFVSKIGWVALVVLVGVGLAALGLHSWLKPVSGALGPWELFDLFPPAFIGFSVLAFALGTFLGMLIARPVPAMAVTLGLTIAARWGFTKLRPFFMKAQTEILDAVQIAGGRFESGKDWILRSALMDQAGARIIREDLDRLCPMRWQDSNFGRDLACFARQGWQMDITFHPLEHLWALQWIEAGILIALAGSLIFLTWYVFKRRLS
jgi:hypothetical protein